MSTIALIYPPTCDPTAPYLSVPTLTGYLRTHGVDVLPIDANIEAYDRLLRRDALLELAERIERRLRRMERQRRLTHVEQLAYIVLQQAQQDARIIPEQIADAVAVLRDRSSSRFFDPRQYDIAIHTVERAMRLISAAYTPLTLTFLSYRTPFALLNLQEIQTDAQPERNPFHAYFLDLCAELARNKVRIVGLSVAFPGQIQPAYALALTLRQHLPEVYVTVGGPAITQLLVRLSGDALTHALTPFDSAILFEGEQALLDLVRARERGERPTGIITGTQTLDLGTLPAPDFDGLPLDKYLAPALVLPYDPTRGCYWGKCAFCHYGLTASGTACYRERRVEQVVEHLKSLQEKYHHRMFYFSHDSMSPKMAARIAHALQEAHLNCRWGTDMRPEASLTPEMCEQLAAGGALSVALGIESGAPRVLKLINKGIALNTVETAITNLAQAGIAVEAMCFTNFPTETSQEARLTIRLIKQFHDQIALFICGEFALVHGARIAQFPDEYGIREIWRVNGDEFRTGLFYAETKPAKTETERGKIDRALDRVAGGWWLHGYPWAGSLSTAHTLLWYDHYGPAVFKQFARQPRLAEASIELPPELEMTWEHESAIWHELIYVRRTVTRTAYRQLAAAYPAVVVRPRRRAQQRR